MDNEKNNQTIEEKPRDYLLSLSIFVSALLIAGAWIYTAGLKYQANQATGSIEKNILPPGGINLPISWGDLGVKMVDAGVIDKKKFELLYPSERNEMERLLSGSTSENLQINSENSGMILNLLWALGLGNKNDILEKGPMTDMRYGGPQNFASTAGWTIAQGNPMDHYSKHEFIVLTPEKQQIVERIAKNIYRPCCDNATYFPDCNHGMAMLGLLELMASQGISEEEMYKVALQVNAYWFPDTYLTIAQYLASRGIDWNEADPKEILGANYSSASGYKQILSQVTTPTKSSGGGCGA
ncbi:hypothetical protein HYV91_01465 [Candidatus Wolfebacteria bacterium]|nr:hypothetical protein [Candidatus Wolfebacteria bacterium]